MGIAHEHDLHRRRGSRNVGLALVLAAFVALVFGLSVVKIRNGDLMQAFDHQPRVSVLPADATAPARQPASAPVVSPGVPAPRVTP